MQRVSDSGLLRELVERADLDLSDSVHAYKLIVTMCVDYSGRRMRQPNVMEFVRAMLHYLDNLSRAAQWL